MTAQFNLKHFLKDHAYQNRPLTFEEGYLLGLYTLFPYRDELKNLFYHADQNLFERKESAAKRSLAVLCALHNKRTYDVKGAAEQVAGICAAVFDYDIRISKNGYLKPNVEYAIDNCGMGGDVLVTPNVSTVAAIIAASSRIPICKHGSPANADKGRHGSSDFMSDILGLPSFEGLIGLSKKKIEELIERFNYGYIEALDSAYKTIHLQTHKYADLPHMNDLIGPITNPLHPNIATKKIIGVNSLVAPVLVAEVYKIMNNKGVTNLQDGMFVRGYVYRDRVGPYNNDGIDELSIMSGGTRIARFMNGSIEEYDLYAEDFGLKTVLYRDIKPDKRGKGPFSLDILRRKEIGAAKELVLANAALIEHLARGTSLKEAYFKMKETLESNAPYENIMLLKEELINRSKG